MTTENITMNDSAYGAAKEREQAQTLISVMSMLLNRADGEIDSNQKDLDKFTKDLLGSHPAYAFEWAHGIMQSTARANVAEKVKRTLTNGGHVWNIRNDLQDKLMQGAKYPSFSTSPTSNLMSQFMTSGVAEWLEIIERAIAALEAKGIKNPSATDEA
jgi:hypothetical protein